MKQIVPKRICHNERKLGTNEPKFNYFGGEKQPRLAEPKSYYCDVPLNKNESENKKDGMPK